MSAPKTVPVTPEMLRRLRNAYRHALASGKKPDDVIKVMGYEFVVGYLKYLIEYIEMRLSMTRPGLPLRRKGDDFGRPI